jgi:hypothetical protein
LADEHYEEVHHPDHYLLPDGVEVIDLVEHLPFNVANALKYLFRAGRKPGVDADIDRRKAIWYLQRERERVRQRDH